MLGSFTSDAVAQSTEPLGIEPRLTSRKLGVNYNQNEIAITANGFGNPPNAVNPNFSVAAGTGADILYQTATSINSIFGYAPNSAAITTSGANNLPTTTGGIGVTEFPSNPKTIVNYHYSLDTQYQFPFDMIASPGYMGTLRYHCGSTHHSPGMGKGQNSLHFN